MARATEAYVQLLEEAASAARQTVTEIVRDNAELRGSLDQMVRNATRGRHSVDDALAASTSTRRRGRRAGS